MTEQPRHARPIRDEEWDQFTPPGRIPDASDPNWHLPPAEQAEWLARGLKHPAGRGWEPASAPLPRKPGPQWPQGWQPGDPPVQAQSPRDDDPYENMRKFDMAARVTFLDTLASCGEVRTAAVVAGVSRETVYRARRRWPQFARLWDAARIQSRARAEAVLATNALDGVEVPVFLRGEHVATYRRQDPRYLLAHLARLDKFVEDNPLARADADQFEAMLAAMAGQAMPDAFAMAAFECGDGIARDDAIVPTRAQYVAWLQNEAHQAEVGGHDSMDLWADRTKGPDGAPLSEEELAARDEVEWAAVEYARVAAEQEYDCWRAGNGPLIDRMTGWASDPEECAEDAGAQEEAPEAPDEPDGPEAPDGYDALDAADAPDAPAAKALVKRVSGHGARKSARKGKGAAKASRKGRKPAARASRGKRAVAGAKTPGSVSHVSTPPASSPGAASSS